MPLPIEKCQNICYNGKGFSKIKLLQMEKNKMNISEFWNNISDHQGEVFVTAKGCKFTYQIAGNRFHVFRNGLEINRVITKNDFEKAMNYHGSCCNELANSVNGSSYVKAVLCDNRIDIATGFSDFNDCKKSFKYAGKIKPCLDENGHVITYKAYNIHSRYLNNPDYQLMDLPREHPYVTKTPYEVIGNRDFCKIDMKQLNLPDCPGVYLWVINNVVVYIGRARPEEPLKKRFSNGYSRISCRPCWKKVRPVVQRGQSTNMKMNLLVYSCYQNNIDINLYYCETKDSAELETELLNSNWEFRDPTRLSTCVYNDRR